jgi:hypothetical protein
MKRLINIILFIAISFSIAHGVVLDTHQDEHCSIKEFVTEFSEPISHEIDEHKGDLCNTHFMLHISYLIPNKFYLCEIDDNEYVAPSKLLSYYYQNLDNTFRPPIA